MINAATSALINNRYRLDQELGHGGMSAIYTAHDRLTGQDVALKRIYIRSGERTSISLSTETTEKRLVLAQEFRTLATLRHPNIIRVLDYGFDSEGQPFYVMELLRDARTITESAADSTTAHKLDLLIQLTNALTYLHRRGILHRDLKPGNVLVVNGVVKVLDFGLAVERETIQTDGTTPLVGTLQYIAPEVYLGEPPSESSDLYAVGVVAYEMFLGAPPFDMSDLRALLNRPVTVDLPGESPQLVMLITRLLAKRRVDRPHDAKTVLETLGEIANRPVEDTSARESFIQSARFVGRETEIALLRGTFKAMIGGSGSFWLIGGESGAGKSRLMDEVRTLALIGGALVIRSQAVNAGGAAYRIFEDVVRRLALSVAPDHAALSVLKTIVPDIGALFDDPVLPDPPALESNAALTRLINAVSQLFLSQTQPLVILLEDLQWAGDGLVILDGVSKLVEGRQILIIGSYRSDEAPELPTRYPTAKVIPLLRMSEAEIEQMTKAILGERVGQERVAELLNRETNGNPFFVVEVLRALAENAGQLDLIGTATLPQSVFAGGILTVVRHRLDQLPPRVKPLLRLAAVIGREIEPEVLRQAIERDPSLVTPEIDLEECLNMCLSRAVLALQDERWLFAHDKLREITLQEIPADQLPALHELAAYAIEAVHGEAADRVAALAYHWGQAGKTDKELHYAARAGQANVESGAYAQAVVHLTRALQLMGDRTDIPALDRARLLRLIGQAYFYSGQIQQAIEYLYQAVAYATRPIPRAGLGFKAATAVEMTRQLSRRIRGIKPQMRVNAQKRAALMESSRALFLLGEMTVYTGDTSKGTYIGMRALNESERAGPSDALVRHLTGTSWVLSANPRMRSMSRQYLDLGMEVAAQVQDDAASAFAHFIAALLAIGGSEWAEVEKHAVPGVELSQRSGDLRTLVSIRGVQADAVFLHDGDLERSIDMQTESYQLTLQGGSVNQMALAQSRRAYLLALSGEWNAAHADARAALALENPQNLTFLNAQSALVISALFREDVIAAREFLTAMLERLEAMSSLNIYAMVEGAAVCADGWIMTAERNRDYLPQAERAVAQIQRAAVSYPLAEPRALLYGAWLAHIKGDASVEKVVETAQTRAQALGLVYDQGLAWYVHSRVTPDAEKRRESAHQAVKQFSRLLIPYDLRRATRSGGGDQGTLSTSRG